MNKIAYATSTFDATHLWPQVCGWLEKALNKTGSILDANDLLRGVRSGGARLWSIHRDDRLVGVFVTEIARGGNGRAVNVRALGGVEMPEWSEDCDAAVQAYAEQNGCVMIVEMGRRGWTRVLDRLGWSAGPAVMMKVIR